MIKQLANEFVKNIKIMFRNWTTLSLLVIAPLILILLVGYAFSSDELTGIRMGVIADSSINLSQFENDVSAYSTIIRFDSVEECVAEMALEKVHICIGLQGKFLGTKENSAKPSLSEGQYGSVVYYYDNTRKKVSLALVSSVQEFFGLKAEQISIESAGSIIESIQNLIEFINERKADITQIKNESYAIRADLVDRKEKMEAARRNFMPSYTSIKNAQISLHNYSNGLNSLVENTTSAINDALAGISRFRDTAGSGKFSFDDEMNAAWNQTLIDALVNTTGTLEFQLSEVISLTNATTSLINQMVAEIDSTISRIDSIKILLDDEIARNDEYISKIDASIERIDNVSAELDTKLSSLNELNPEMAEKLVKPIAYEYNVLLKDAKNIQIAFPQLAVIIIMFIAILFSNIAALMEINSKAYLRSLIAPANDTVYVFGLVLTSTAIVFAQVLVLFAVAQTRLGIEIMPILWQSCIVSALLILIFILAGMIFAYTLGTVQSSILVTTFTALLVFMFGNTVSVIEAMPGPARFFSAYNPIVIAEYVFRQIQLFRTPFRQLVPEIMLLVIYACVLLIAVILAAKNKNRKRE